MVSSRNHSSAKKGFGEVEKKFRVCGEIIGESGEVKVFILLPFLLVGCSRPGAQSEVVVPKPVKVEVKTPLLTKKVLAGRLTLVGLSEEELSEIRVIPETGRVIFVPVNRRYDQVDGLWWKGDRERWLKIPDHGEVWIGRAPKGFDGETKLGKVQVFYRSQPLWALANAMRGGVKGPGWVSDAGRTKSPVGWPWEKK